MKTKTIPRIITLDDTDGAELIRVPIRQYMRNYKKYNDMIKETKQSIIITNQEDDIVVISPVKKKVGKISFEQLRKELTFKGGKDLSKNIDKIVYGI